MKTVHIATGNLEKFKSAVSRLAPFNIECIQARVSIIEPQDEDIAKVAEFKVKQAFSQLQEPVLISDVGWGIPSLNGFPGPFMHFMSDWFTGLDFEHLLLGKTDRTVIIDTVAAFADSHGVTLFSSERVGSLNEKAYGKGIAIDQLATFRADKKSLAECKELGLEYYDKDITDSVWSQFGEWFARR